MEVGRIAVPARISEWLVQYTERWADGKPLDEPLVWVPNIGEWVRKERARGNVALYNPWYGTREGAESDALLLALRWPSLIGVIEVVEVVHCLA